MNTPEFTNPPRPSHFYDDPKKVAPFNFRNVRYDKAKHIMTFTVGSKKCLAQDILFKGGYLSNDKKFHDVIKIQILQMYHVSAYNIESQIKGGGVDIIAKILPEKDYIKDWLNPYNDEMRKFHHVVRINNTEVNFYEDPFHDSCKNIVSATYKTDTMIQDFIYNTTPILNGSILPQFIKYRDNGPLHNSNINHYKVHYNSIFAETDIPNVCIGCFFLEKICDNHYYTLTPKHAAIILDNYPKPENDESIEYDSTHTIENLKIHLLQLYDITNGVNTSKDINIRSVCTFFCSTLDKVVLNVEYSLNFYKFVDNPELTEKHIYIYNKETPASTNTDTVIIFNKENLFIHDILNQIHVEHTMKMNEDTDIPEYTISINS